MISNINFGGLSKPAPKPQPLVAPDPVEHQNKKQEIVKNKNPKQIDE